jgi:hypothetical protein
MVSSMEMEKGSSYQLNHWAWLTFVSGWNGTASTPSLSEFGETGDIGDTGYSVGVDDRYTIVVVVGVVGVVGVGDDTNDEVDDEGIHRDFLRGDEADASTVTE